MIGDGYAEGTPFEEEIEGWELDEEEWELDEEETGPPGGPPWRKSLLIVTAAVTAIAMGLVPLYNVFFSRTLAENGLEVCGFDYCVVVDAVREAGLDTTLGWLGNRLLDDDEAAELALAAARHLGVAPPRLEVVDDLEGRLGGVYEPSADLIRIERPVRAWTVLHEVAHIRASGHGGDFQRLLIDLARWADGSGG